MNINGKVLDSIKVHVPACSDEKYLSWLKEGLCLKHQQLLLQSETEPFFYLDIASVDHE